jgi:hypothetical protein
MSDACLTSVHRKPAVPARLLTRLAYGLQRLALAVVKRRNPDATANQPNAYGRQQ